MKDLRIETSNGIISLDHCEIMKVRKNSVIIRWMPTKLFVRDSEITKLENIIRTQLVTNRDFYVNEEKDFIVFEYPIICVKGSKESNAPRFTESI